MTQNLETQIRAYFDEFDTTLEPVDVEDFATQHVPASPSRRRWNPAPAWALAAGAFVVLLAVIGGVALFVGGGSEEPGPVTDPPTTTIVTTTLAPTTTSTAETTTIVPEVSPIPVAGEAPLTWRRVENTALTRFDESSIAAIAAGGPGLVAVGNHSASTPEGEFDFDAAVWISTDGEVWERVESAVLGTGIGDPDGQLEGMADVATNEDRIVAVGSEGYAAAVWTSGDGYSWERVVDDDLPPGTIDSAVNAVAVHEDGFIAVGSHRSDAGIWMSSDGLDWTRIEDDDLLGDSSGQVTLWDVTAYESGFVAVGDNGFDNQGEGEDLDTLIAVSANGLDWERIPVVDEASREEGLFLPPELVRRNMGGSAVSVIDGQLFATSLVGVREGALFTSTNGRSWYAVPVPSGAGQGGLAAWGDYVVTAGWYEGLTPAVWLTADDLTEWLVAPLGDNAGFHDVLSFGNRLLAVGASFGANFDDDQAGIWIGTWDG